MLLIKRINAKKCSIESYEIIELEIVNTMIGTTILKT